MSEAKHTPEPWRAYKHEWCKTKGLVAKDGRVVIVEGRAGASECGGLSAANADRIVACVNAMKGIPDPQAFRDQSDAKDKMILEMADALYEASIIVSEQWYDRTGGMRPGTPFISTDRIGKSIVKTRKAIEAYSAMVEAKDRAAMGGGE